MAWREFAVAGDSNSRNSIMFTRSTDGGQTFTKAAPITPNGYAFVPFDQASRSLTFRTNAYPTIAVVPAEADGRTAGQPGRVYVAWTARGFGGARPNDARILISTSIGGSDMVSTEGRRRLYERQATRSCRRSPLPAASWRSPITIFATIALRSSRTSSLNTARRRTTQCIASGQNSTFGFAAGVHCMIKSERIVAPSHARHARGDRRLAVPGQCLVRLRQHVGARRQHEECRVTSKAAAR